MEPDCAELLLLAGKHSPLFARIRYVIFDEVHNIVSKEGSVWEHLLTFINAPFVALSATVGNPEDFMSWLQRLETVRGHHRSTQIFMNMYFFCAVRASCACGLCVCGCADCGFRPCLSRCRPVAARWTLCSSTSLSSSASMT